MPKTSQFTMKLESRLRDAFMAEAKAIDRPASQLVREFMRVFVEYRRGPGTLEPTPAEPVPQAGEKPSIQAPAPEPPRKTVLEEPRSLMDRILGGHIRL